MDIRSVDIRSLKNYNQESFQQSLLGVDWSKVLTCDNVNSAWNSFKHIFLSILDQNAPMKRVRIKQRTEDWIDSDVLQCIKDRDAAFYTYKRNKTEDNLLAFRESRNKAQSYIFKAKRVILILFLVIVVIQSYCGVVLSNLGYLQKKIKLLAILA